MSGLFEQIMDLGNLLRGWERVEENAGSAGYDRVSVDDFEERLDEELLVLADELERGVYRPQPLVQYAIPKRGGGKRILQVPAVRDRVAQSSALEVLAPLFEPEFEESSFGYRRGRSVQQAVARIQALRNRGFRFLVDADIEQFFDRVDHRLLLEKLSEYIDDGRVIRLIDQWLKVDVWDGLTLTPRTRGLPQGAPVSPLLANVYLDSFDEAFAEEGYHLVRYCDDFVVLCRTRPQAEQALELTDELLRDLELNLNLEKTRVTSFESGFEYLGALFVGDLVLKKQKWEEEEVPDVPVPVAGKRLSIPAEPFLRTLYVQEQGTVLRREGEQLVVTHKDEEVLAVPIIKVAQVVILGRCEVTTPALTLCLERDVPLTFLSSRGRYYGRLESMRQDRAELHRLQFYREANPEFVLSVARVLVETKLHNSRLLLKRNQARARVEEEAGRLATAQAQTLEAKALEPLRGYEGAAAAAYFPALGRLLLQEFAFARRTRQPPTDPANSLLSFGYTLLFYNMFSLLRVHGLQPYVGCLHTGREGFPALAADLVEPYRSPLVDSLVLTLINKRIFSRADFHFPKEPGSPCLLTDEARKRFLTHFEGKMQSRVQHPTAGSRLSYRRCMEFDVVQYVQVLRDPGYPFQPFRLRS